MASELSVGLSHLQQLLAALETAEGKLTEGPRRVSLGERQVAAAEKAIEQQKDEITACRKRADDLNLRLKTKEAELLKLTGLLNQAKSNKEYDIVKGQIAAAQTAKGEIEDEALVAFEQTDAAQSALNDLRKALEQKKKELSELQKSVDAERPGLEAAVSELQGKITEAEKIIPDGDARVTWKRIRTAHGASALSAMDDGFCSNCSSRVTTQDSVRINMGDFLLCRECGRLLFNC
ncbi:MAG: hypothetical protein KDA96_25430 [Planctomycetaceae bacterium]|nr:hypothetical protein [Planctomycetaceae bacterium]